MFAQLLATALGLLALPQDGTYRATFDAGLAALTAGLDEQAAEHFRAAGEFAPDAPLWRAYLAHAEGGEPVVQAARPGSSDEPWATASRSQTHDAVFDPTGERLLCGGGTPTLWDARTGERIAALAHRSSEHGLFWKFDVTGRVLVGVGGRWSARFGSVRGLDVRDARTGDPLDVPGAEEVVVTRDTRFEWVPAGQPARDLALGHIVDLPCAGGVLRCRVVPTRTNEDCLIRPDHERALLLYRNVPTELRLVDPKTGEPLALIQPGGGSAWFSPSGEYALSTNRFPAEVFLLDAETGKRLPSPPLPQEREYHVWGIGFLRDQLVVVDWKGGVLYWDPRAGAEVRRLQLDPVPHAGVDSVAFADAGRVLLVHTFHWTQGYDSATGQELWSLPDLGFFAAEALAPDGLRLATNDGTGAPLVVDVRTGEMPDSFNAQQVLATKEVTLVEGTGAALLTASDGSLRRIDLKSGVTTSIAEEHRSGDEVSTRLLSANRMLSWVDGEQLFLRDSTTLKPIHSIALEPDSEVLAIAPDGSQIVVRTPEALLEVRTLSNEPQVFRIRAEREEPVSAAYSPDGTRWAVAYERQVQLYDTLTRTRISKFLMRGGKVREPKPMSFYGEDRLAIAWGGSRMGKYGVNVFQLPHGERLAQLEPSGMLFNGGHVRSLRCDEDLGRITFSISPKGYVGSFAEEDWSERWFIDYGGGNPGRLFLERASGSTRLHVSGMSTLNARIVDLITGEELEHEAPECWSLSGTDDDRFVVGLLDRALLVFRGEDFTELYRRTEGPGGSAWIVRDKVHRTVVGPASPLSDSRHLTRGEVSRPIDCWDAWLHDPLELATASLDALPTPPRIVSGPPRLLQHLGETVELELHVADGAALLGIEVETVGGEARFVPVTMETTEATNRMQVTFSGPWPAEVRLRAVNRSGARSAPWRVRLAHPVETPRDR